MKNRTVIRSAMVASMSAVALLSSTVTAQAYNWQEDANWGDPAACSGTEFKFTFYFNSNQAGARRNLGYNHANLAATDMYHVPGTADPDLDYPLKFCPGTGNGAGQGLKNNAASVTNRHTSYAGYVYYSSWWQGAFDATAPATPLPRSRNLANTYNENASFKWQ